MKCPMCEARKVLIHSYTDEPHDDYQCSVCGTGGYAERLATQAAREMADEYNITSLSFVPTAVAEARRRVEAE